jgi:hypothetical protein
LAASSPYDIGTGGTLDSTTSTITSTTSTLTGTVSALTGSTPSPSPSSNPLQPVVDTVTGTVGGAVQQVSNATGLPNPLATPTPTPTGGNSTPTGGNTGSGGGGTSGSGGTVHQGGVTYRDNLVGKGAGGTSSAPATHVSVPAAPITVTSAAGLPSRSWVGSDVSSGGQSLGSRQVFAAGPGTLLAPRASGLTLPPGNDTGPRALLIIVATAVVGGLSAAHVAVAHRRLATISA